MRDEWLEKYPPSNEKDREEAPPARLSPKAGKTLKPEAVLDLHGKTKEEAAAALENFLLAGSRTGYRKVLVIHGKGRHSEGKAVLPDLVREVLERSPEAGEFGPADSRNGGSGAVWVMLRQRSR